MRVGAFFFFVLMVSGCRELSPPNVLFIAVDDLRPQFEAYGKGFVHTPNLDRLAGEGFVFSRAYANVPVCGASRASLLTGLRPTQTRFLTYDTRVDIDAPDIVTLPQYFKQNGYYSVSLGKVFHHLNDSPDSWSEPPWHPDSDPSTRSASWRNYLRPENIVADTSGTRRGPPFEAVDVPESAYYDGIIALRAVKILRQVNEKDEPFFLAVGFLKPHLPFNAPQRFWDLYTPETIHTAEVPFLPEGAPLQAWHDWGELRQYAGIPASAPVPDSIDFKLVHGYYAGISYVDAQIGLLLGEVDRLGLLENTIVVLWGDHGWSLGEHGLWCKHSPFNVAVQAPLLVRVPDLRGGEQISALVEFVDLYPSLVEMAGLQQPAHLQGQSFVRLIEDPDLPGKGAVFPRWLDAESIRTERFLYTEWLTEDGVVAARMLYNHDEDPGETVNLAEKSQYASVVADLHHRLHAMIASR